MFSFLKSKPTLASLIPNNYVDIHSHVLPGIDDGAKNLKDSQFLMESMIGFGFKKCITSPHTMANVYNNTIESITNAKSSIEKELSDLAQKLDLHAASEIYINKMQIVADKSGKFIGVMTGNTNAKGQGIFMSLDKWNEQFKQKKTVGPSDGIMGPIL